MDQQQASGTALPSATMKLERLPDILGLQAGSLEDPSIYRPAMEPSLLARSRGIIWIRPSKSTRTECRRGDR